MQGMWGARAASRQGPASTLPAQPLRARLPCAEQAGVVAGTPAASAMPHSNHSTLPHYIRHADAVLCPRGAPTLSPLPISCRRLALRDGVSPQRSKAPLQCSTRRLPCTWAGSGTRYRHDRTHNARGGRRITPPRHARARLCSPFGQLVLSRAARGFFSRLFFPSLFCGTGYVFCAKYRKQRKRFNIVTIPASLVPEQEGTTATEQLRGARENGGPLASRARARVAVGRWRQTRRPPRLCSRR